MSMPAVDAPLSTWATTAEPVVAAPAGTRFCVVMLPAWTVMAWLLWSEDSDVLRLYHSGRSAPVPLRSHLFPDRPGQRHSDPRELANEQNGQVGHDDHRDPYAVK